MRVSELSTQTGTSIATIKFYIREGLLPKGRTTAATQASYDEKHVTRLGLIKALTDPCGLSLAQVRLVIDTLDGPISREQKPAEVVSALSRHPSSVAGSKREADDLLDAIGLEADAAPLAVNQLLYALRSVQDAGLSVPLELTARVLPSIQRIVDEELGQFTYLSEEEPAALIALHEPVLLALRRLVLLQRLPASSVQTMHPPACE